MTGKDFCGCAMSVPDRRESSRWWCFDTVFVRCVLVLIMLTIPTSVALEDGAQKGEESYYGAVLNYTYRDPVTGEQISDTKSGKYGTKSLVEQRTGKGVHVRGIDNKSHGCDEYNITLPKVPWIALVERGGCFFSEKIRIATQTYNATAVIIYNNEKRETIMQHDVEDQVSISVSRKIGKMLADLADRGGLLEITIIPGKEEAAGGGSTQNSISKTSVLFVSISFIVLMIISLAWLVFYYIQRFRYAHAKERLARRLASAAKKAIAKIPQKTVKAGDKELDSEFDQCAVCIEGYKPHDVIRTLPCKHVFHKSCVDPWLLDQRSCPMCKLDILRAYGMQVMGSQESVHQDAENANIVAPVEDHEPSSTTDDQIAADTEVKVLLLPHTCLHFHPGQESTSDTLTAAGTSSQEECHSPSSSSSIKNCSSADHLSHTSSQQDSETQALMDVHRDGEEDEEEEEDEDEHHHSARLLAEKEKNCSAGDSDVPLVLELPEKTRRQVENC